MTEKQFLDAKLPFIFGRPNVEKFLKFKKIIDESKFSYGEINNLYFFPSKRWDIELRNKITIKLPRENVRYSLDNVFRFLENEKIKNIKKLVYELKIKLF